MDQEIKRLEDKYTKNRREYFQWMEKEQKALSKFLNKLTKALLEK